jgi:hypothetical protein
MHLVIMLFLLRDSLKSVIVYCCVDKMGDIASPTTLIQVSN